MPDPAATDLDAAQALPPSPGVQRSRRLELDGLRGVAIVLVVLSHGWLLWIEESDRLGEHDVWGAWFRNGNYAVSIFFVIGAFLATRGMLALRDSPAGLDPGRVLLRRVVRLTGQVALLMLVVLVVTSLDESDTYAGTDTRTSVFRILTYTWNWYLQSSPLTARPDLGNLWYLSVDMQVFVLILGLVFLLRRSPRLLPVVLGGLLVASVAWKAHVYDLEGDYFTLLRTTTRMDAPLAGALAATVMPLLGPLRPIRALLTLGGLVALVPLLYANDSTGVFLSWGGQLLNLALVAFVVGATLGPVPRVIGLLLGNRPLTFLGRHSLSIFLWHYPLFFFISRQTPDWSWPARTALGLALLMGFALVSEWFVERRVQQLLASPAWQRAESGLLRSAATAVVRAWRRARRSRRGTHVG